MNNTQITPRLLTYRQAAKYLGVCEKSVYNLVQAGHMQAVRIGEASVRFGDKN